MAGNTATVSKWDKADERKRQEGIKDEGLVVAHR